jgi:Ca2+/H+ antiporter
MKAARALVLLAIVVAIPELSLACPVCTGGQTDQVQKAFLSATLFMTGLPLGMIALIGLALRRRLKQVAALEAADDVRPRLAGPGVNTA